MSADNITNTLNKNFQRHLKSQESYNKNIDRENIDRENDELVIDYSKKIYELIPVLSEWIGVQPFDGAPLKYAYQMMFKSSQDDSNDVPPQVSLEILSFVVEAKSLRCNILLPEMTAPREELAQQFVFSIFKRFIDLVVNEINPLSVTYPSRILNDLIISHSTDITVKTRRPSGSYALIPDNEIYTNSLQFTEYSPKTILPGVDYCGTIDEGQVRIYKTKALTDTCIVGRKGDGETDSGCSYCPFYIDSESLSGVKIDPVTFSPCMDIIIRDTFGYIPENFQNSFSTFKIQSF